MTVLNVVRGPAPSVWAASPSERSIWSIASEIVTSGSVEKKMPWEMMTFSIRWKYPVDSQKTWAPIALMTGGNMNGRMPSA